MCFEAAEPVFDMSGSVEVGGVDRVRRRHAEYEGIGRCCCSAVSHPTADSFTSLVGLRGCGANARWRGSAGRKSEYF